MFTPPAHTLPHGRDTLPQGRDTPESTPISGARRLEFAQDDTVTDVTGYAPQAQQLTPSADRRHSPPLSVKKSQMDADFQTIPPAPPLAISTLVGSASAPLILRPQPLRASEVKGRTTAAASGSGGYMTLLFASAAASEVQDKASTAAHGSGGHTTSPAAAAAASEGLEKASNAAHGSGGHTISPFAVAIDSNAGAGLRWTAEAPPAVSHIPDCKAAETRVPTPGQGSGALTPALDAVDFGCTGETSLTPLLPSRSIVKWINRKHQVGLKHETHLIGRAILNSLAAGYSVVKTDAELWLALMWQHRAMLKDGFPEAGVHTVYKNTRAALQEVRRKYITQPTTTYLASFWTRFASLEPLATELLNVHLSERHAHTFATATRCIGDWVDILTTTHLLDVNGCIKKHGWFDDWNSCPSICTVYDLWYIRSSGT